MIHFIIIIIISNYSVVECLNVTKIDTETVLLSWTQDSVPDNSTVEVVFKVVGDRYSPGSSIKVMACHNSDITLFFQSVIFMLEIILL